MHYSTETVIIEIKKYIRLNSDSGKISVLVLLDHMALFHCTKSDFIKSKISEIFFIGEQRKVNKCRTKSGKKWYYIYCSLYCCKMHSWKTSNIFIYKYICCKIKIHCVTACRPTVLMRILCAEWCTWTRGRPICVFQGRYRYRLLQIK